MPVSDPAPHIGTLREKPLHASLKEWYAQPGDDIEVPIGGYVIDIVRQDLLIEIQTSGFSSMKNKLSDLLRSGRSVRIVYPVAENKWIVKVDEDGTILSRRRSPKHGMLTDLFAELVSFPTLLTESDLEVDIVLTHEEEYRRRTPGKSWRRKGWSVMERRLVDVTGNHLLTSGSDICALLPSGLPVVFTTGDLAKALERPRRAAQQMAYCLRETGMIETVGKQGNAFEYRVSRTGPRR